MWLPNLPNYVLHGTAERKCPKNDLVLQARGFRWAFGLLSLVAMFRYIRFPQITHGKRIVAYIGNRKQICWKKQSALSEKV